MDKFKNAFKWHKTNAQKRGVKFLFTFEEWKTWWEATAIGILEELAKTNTVCAEIMMQARMLYGMCIALQTVKI